MAAINHELDLEAEEPLPVLLGCALRPSADEKKASDEKSSDEKATVMELQSNVSTLTPDSNDSAMEKSEPEDAPTSQKQVWAMNATLLLLVWAVVFIILMPKCFGKEQDCQHPGLPGGSVFDVLLVLVVGFSGGYLVLKTSGLPALLGMLIAGYVLKNQMAQLGGISAGLNSTIRNMALAMIMLRAGMGLDLNKLRESAATTTLLSFVPCLGEATTIAFIARLFFPSLSLPFAFMLGFCIADVSPAVTTPILLDFMSRGLGEKKGIPGVLLAAGSVNSVVAIVLYSICWEFAWTDSVSPEKLAEIVAVKLVVQIVGVGGIAGYVIGRMLEFGWRYTANTNQRFLLTFLVSLITLFGFKHVGMGGGGTLALVTLGATLQHRVNDQSLTQPVDDIMAMIWSKAGSVMLFTLLGASVDQSKLGASVLLPAAAIVIIGLAGRLLTVFGCSMMVARDWNLQERAFALVAQCPKATVQAALATVALDHVNGLIASGTLAAGSPETLQFLETANMILTTAVLSIMMTAPTFAVVMVVCGNKWLAPRAAEDCTEQV